MIDFEIDPEFKQKLVWVREFVDDKVVKMDALWPHPSSPHDHELVEARKLLKPMQDQVKRRGLWALHLDEELGGQGLGQVYYLHLSEILGRTNWGSLIFGCQAPDSGNIEILARYGTEEQKEKYLQPLLDGELAACADRPVRRVRCARTGLASTLWTCPAR